MILTISTIYLIGACVWTVIYIYYYRFALEFESSNILAEAFISAIIWPLCVIYCVIWMIGMSVERYYREREK